MSLMRFFQLLIASLLLSACASAPVQEPVRSHFCDAYLIYTMCARDLDGDAITDIMYFDDDDIVFMYHPGSASVMQQAGYQTHRCVMLMDEVTREITTAMLAEDENTTLLESLDLKKRLLLRYNQRRHEMDACNARYERPQDAEPFGHDDFADFPDDELEKG